MPRRKSSSSGGNKKDEAKQKGAHDQGGIPSVPESQDSEGACGQSPSPSEDKVQTEQSQYTDGREEPDGSGSSRITGGHTLSKKEKKEKEKERKEAKKREKEKQVREKKETERQEKERKESEKQKEKERKKMEKQKTRNASQSKQRNSSSQDAQPPVSPNESHLPQEHRNPSEGSQSSQALAGIEDATLEEGTKQTSSEEAQGDGMQTTTVDEPPVFEETESGQMTASKDEKDKRIAELEEQSKRLAEELKETKSNRIQKLETEIELLRAKEAEFNTQHQEHMNDLRAALQRKHDEMEKLTHDHATEMKVMQDDHSKRMSQLHQERTQSESEKDEEAKRLKQRLQEKDKVNQEIEEKIKLLRRESVQLKEKLKEKEGDEEELCPLPPNHQLEEIKKQKEELENKHALELSRLEAALEEKAKLEEKCREEADKLRLELEVAKEKHANDVEQLHELQQKDEQAANTLREELKDASEKHADEVRRLQTALKDKDEHEVTKLRLELEELTAKNAKEIQQLKAELEEKEAQYTKAIADVKAEYEDKHKAEERQKEAEVERKVKRQEAVSSGVLREKKNEIEKLKKECEDKDNAIVGLTEKLNKMKEEYEQKELETEKQVEAMKSEIEELQHEQRKQHVAEASKKQKEHDRLIEIKTKEIESLRNKLHQVSKEAPETVQRLQEQLQEKDRELNTVVTEIKTLRNHNETLTAEHEHLQHLHGQLKVELKMKRELDECNECSSTSDPSNTTVIEPVNQHSSDTRTTEEERDFQSASESSFTEREEDSTLTSMERMKLLQRAATAEEDAKKARELAQQARDSLQKLDEEREALQAKLEAVNKQVQRLKEWHRLAADTTQQTPSNEATAHVPQEETLLVNREKHVQLKKNFLLLTDKIVKMETSQKQLLEKLQDRDKQIKELQEKVGDTSILPNVYELSSGDEAESAEDLSHDAALREIRKHKATILELRNQVASLQSQVTIIEKTTSDNSKLEKHGKEQSKVVMEWRHRCEVAEKTLKEYEDELQVLKGEVSANLGQQKDSIDVQQLQADYEGKIEALETALNVAKAELTAKCTAHEHTCEHLEQEKQGLRQQLQDLDLQYTHLKTLYGSVTQQLSQLDKCQSEVDVIKEQAAAVNEAMTAKTIEAMDLKEEKETLQNTLKGIAEELERRKIEAQTYEEDFKTERNDREKLASKFEEDKAAMHLEHQAVVGDLKKQVEDLECQIELKQTLMKQEYARLEGEIQNLRGELKKVQEQNEKDSDALQVAFGEKQSLEDAHSKLDNKFREKEAQLEKALVHKADMEDQLKKSRENHEHEVNQLQHQLQQLNDKLLAERTELRQQIVKANEDIAAWSGDCQAKTQQVKQYKKQVDTFRAQVDGLTAELRDNRVRFAEYEKQLGYYQEQVKQLTEDEEQKTTMMRAQFEADMLNVNRDLEKLKREKVIWEMTKQTGDQRGPASTCDEQAIVHVQSLTQQVEKLQKSNHEMDIELQSQQNKYLEVTEKCEVYWRQIDALKNLLQQSGISVPKLEQPSTFKGRYPTVHPMGQQDNMQNPAQSPQPGQQSASHAYQGHVAYGSAERGEQYGRHGDANTLPARRNTMESQMGGGRHEILLGGTTIGGFQSRSGVFQRGQPGQSAYQQPAAQAHSPHMPHSSPPSMQCHPGPGGGGVPGNYYQPQDGQQHLGNVPVSCAGVVPDAVAGAGQLGLPSESQQHIRSGPQENALIQGINTEIHTVAAGVGREVDRNPEVESLSPQAPLDPNLICPMCRRQFRIGEIQKYRQHVKLCHGT